MRSERSSMWTKSMLFRLPALAGVILVTGLLVRAVNAGNAGDAVSFGKGSDILKDPEKFVGKTVTLKEAEIEEVLTDKAFVVESGMMGMGSGLLVVSKNKFKAAAKLPGGAFQKGNDVAITGVVQMVSAADFNKQIGWEIGADWKDKFDKKPMIVASEVMLLEKE